MCDSANVCSQPLGDILQALASDSPDWGGGSAVLLGASMGSCLLAMAARVSAVGARKGTFAPESLDASDLEKAGDELEAQARVLARWAAVDGSLYGKVVEAQRLPKEQPEVRAAAIEEALRGAIVGPLEVAEIIVSTLKEAELLVPNCKKANLSDISSGVQMLRQGVRGALLNVKQNCGKREVFASYKERAAEIEVQAQELAERVLAACAYH